MTRPKPPNPLPSRPDRKKFPLAKYEPELALEVCVRIAGGETLKGIMAEKRMPTTATFHTWRVRYPELGKIYSEARVVAGHRYFDDVADLAHQAALPVSDPNAIDSRKASVAITAKQWLAGKLVPQEYGDKIAKVPAVAIQINTTLDMGDGKVQSDEGQFKIELTVPIEKGEKEQE